MTRQSHGVLLVRTNAREAMAQEGLICSVPKGLAGVCGPVWALAPQQFSKAPLAPAQHWVLLTSLEPFPVTMNLCVNLCCAPALGILLSTMNSQISSV